MTWTKSKFGGLPYLPKNVEYPKTSDDRYLFLLAQINFAEVPPLEPFPHKGILQFYIADREGFGVDYRNPMRQDGFQVLYFPDPSDRIEDINIDFSFLPEPCIFSIQNGASQLNFILKVAPDNDAEQIFKSIFKPYFPQKQDKDWEIFIDEYSEFFFVLERHQLEGYPYFIQGDVRESLINEEKLDCLLLQLDSSDTCKIVWGDIGIGHFLIESLALKNLDFSNVLYNWDSC